MSHPLSRGMPKVAWDAYALASKLALVDISREDRRVVQALGNARASAGTHAQDGVLEGLPYCAAADLSVRGLSLAQIAAWLEQLASQGFVAWFRNWPGNLHIHAIYVGVAMKSALVRQCEDYWKGLDALVSHSRVTQEWWYPERERRAVAFAIYEQRRKTGRTATRANTLPKTTERVTYALHVNGSAKPALWMPVHDGVATAPVRAFGALVGLEVHYRPETRSVDLDGDGRAIAVELEDGVGHAPIRQLIAEAGEERVRAEFAPEARRVDVWRK